MKFKISYRDLSVVVDEGLRLDEDPIFAIDKVWARAIKKGQRELHQQHPGGNLEVMFASVKDFDIELVDAERFRYF